MKFYNSFGMNPRLVRMFLMEKGIDVPFHEIDLLAGENRQAGYLAINPTGQTPALELDNGTFLGETGAICEYLEERFPTPPLIGTTAEERAITRMWWRRVEINICVPAVHAFYYKEGYDLFRDRVHCIPEAADGLKVKVQKELAWLNGQLNGPWLAGDRFSVADLTLFTYLDLLRNGGQPLDPALTNVDAWFRRVGDRPSAEASLFPVQPMGLRG